MGAKTKMCPLHFALLSYIVRDGQSQHAAMRGNNAQSRGWASALGQPSDVDLSSGSRAELHAYERAIERSSGCSFMQHSLNECGPALCSLWWRAGDAASRRGRQKGLTSG